MEEKREGISEMTEQATLCAATYSISIISMRCPIRVHSLTDIESPENSCNRDEEGLFGNLLTWTYSSSPSKWRISLLIGICKVARQISIGVKSVRIRIVFRIMIDLGLARDQSWDEVKKTVINKRIEIRKVRWQGTRAEMQLKEKKRGTYRP